MSGHLIVARAPIRKARSAGPQSRKRKDARERMKPAGPFPDGRVSAEKLTNPLPGLSFPRVRFRVGEVSVRIGFGLGAGVVRDGGERNDRRGTRRRILRAGWDGLRRHVAERRRGNFARYLLGRQ